MLALKNMVSQLPGRQALLQQENWEGTVCNALERVKYEEVEEVVRDERGIRRVRSKYYTPSYNVHVQLIAESVVLAVLFCRSKSDTQCHRAETLLLTGAM